MTEAKDWLWKAAEHGEMLAVEPLMASLQGMEQQDSDLMQDHLSSILCHLRRAKAKQQASSAHGVPAATLLLEARLLLHLQRVADGRLSNAGLLRECALHEHVPSTFDVFAQVKTPSISLGAPIFVHRNLLCL